MKFLLLKDFNRLTQSSFNSVKELIFNPLSVQRELELRQKLSNSAYDLSPIFVVDALKDGKIEIYLEAKSYEDSREYLLLKE